MLTLDVWAGAWIVYGAGFILGLLLTDASPAVRFGLAALWPLGPLAFVTTILLLILVATIAFPVFGAVLAALLAWWLLA